MSNNLRTRNGMPFNFVNGLKVRGMDIESLIPGIEGIPEAGSKYQFAGNGSNKAFTLPVTPYNKDAVDVYVKQLYVHPDDYTLVGDTVTLAEAPPALVAGETYNVVIKVSLTTLNGYVNANRVSFEGENLDDILEKSKPLANYSALRAYAGAATQVRITTTGIAGFFYRDDADTASTDNDYSVIVSASGKRWKRIDNGSVSVFSFMTPEQIADVKSGTALIDVTSAIVNAFNYANNLVYTGLSSSIFHPGCKLVLEEGKYNLSSLSSKIYVKCNTENKGASFLISQSYAGEVLRVGYDEAGKQINSARIELPNVHRVNGSAFVAGSVGIRLANINTSKIYFGRVNHFETGIWMGGIGEGTVYCDIFMGQLSYNKRQIYIVPGAGGWCNGNNIYSGNLYQGPLGSVRIPGYYQLYMDGSAPATTVVGNNFHGLSLEGPSSEYVVYAKNAYGNSFFGGYHESAIAAVDVNVSGNTLSVVNEINRPSVGDQISFFGTIIPEGMSDVKNYYVVATPTPTTFKVSLDSSNSSGDTFSTTGSGVKFRLLCRMYFESGSGENTFNNQFFNFFTPPTYGLQIIQNGTTAHGNGIVSQNKHISEAYDLANTPMYRGVNFATGATVRPIYAAYPPTVDPNTDPRRWTVALGDRGVLFAENGTETGRFFNASGILQYRRPDDTTSYEVASCRRSPSIISITSLTCAAATSTSTDITLTGASVYDHVVITPLGILAAGMIYSHAYVISNNTVRVVFYNATNATISLSTTVQAMTVRRFY